MSDTGHHHDGPPGLPEIIDEAGNSPAWLPLAGLGLFALIAIVTVARMQMNDDATDAAVVAPADGADAPADAH